MRYLLLLTSLFIALLATPSLAQQMCAFTTNGSAAAQGLKIKFSVPCQWKSEGSSSKYLQEYEYEDGDAAITEMIKIDKPAKPITPGRIDELIAADAYKNLRGKDGTFLWGTKLKVDGQDCAEVALKVKKTVMFTTLHMYIMRYMLYHKNKAVTVNFMVAAESDEDAKKCFNNYKTTFRNLITATDFLD